MIVIPGTSELHADTFAKALGARVLMDPAPDSGSVLFVGMAPALAPKVKHAKELGLKTIGYWIGSDSLCAMTDSAYRSQIPEMDLHLAVHQRICEELEKWGVKSFPVFPCARNQATQLPAPEAKLVGVYMPEPNLYMLRECITVARENPQLEFVFYGNLGDPYDLPSNCKDIGRKTPEEVSEYLNQFSVTLRLCKHDGYPIGGIEVKQRGRHIIENFPYRGFKYAESLDKVNSLLRDEATHRSDTSEWPEWYRKECSPQRFAEAINTYAEGL